MGYQSGRLFAIGTAAGIFKSAVSIILIVIANQIAKRNGEEQIILRRVIACNNWQEQIKAEREQDSQMYFRL